MNYQKPKLEKRYYSIGELAEMFKVSKSLIRFWEAEFSYLQAHKNAKGERRFTQKNIEQFSLVYHLVKERGFTLEGAKKEIENNKTRLQQKIQMIEKLQNIKDRLLDIKKDL